MSWAIESHPGEDESRIRRPWFEPRPEQHVWSINVLLVEDDAADASLILNVLKRHPQVSSTHAADSPKLALSQLVSGQVEPDLILLDIHMPRMNGFTFLERLRLIPSMASVPVVFLTTSRLAKDVMAARESTAAFYLIKPDTYAELQNRLDQAVKRAMSGAWSR